MEKVIESWDNLPKDTKKRQCFAEENGKCMLKSSHDYFYQIQMQLLVTKRNFCDFILHAENGPVSTERIFRNEQVISQITESITAFWTSCCS